MNLKLVLASNKFKNQITEMLDEWTKYNLENPEAEQSPRVIFNYDYLDFENYVEALNKEITSPSEGRTPSTTYFCYDESLDKMVGAVQIRHELNEILFKVFGHIGDGVRPSFRGQGIGTKMLELALIECKKLGIEKVLISCLESNIPSRKHIMKNGGVLENTVEHDGQVFERYWI